MSARIACVCIVPVRGQIPNRRAHERILQPGALVFSFEKVVSDFSGLTHRIAVKFEPLETK